MRIVLSMVLVMSFANAGAFLDRFNSLEESVEALQTELSGLKGGVTKTPRTSSSSKNDSAEVKSLRKTVQALKRQQDMLLKKLESLSKMRKITPSTLTPVKAVSSVKRVNDAKEEELDIDPEEIQEQFEELTKAISDIKKFSSNNHLKWNVDFRTAYDRLAYKMADGTTTAENQGILTNRLLLDMAYVANENVNFKGQLAYYKMYGQRMGRSNSMMTTFDEFDWIASENPSDDSLHVRSAYYFYRNDTFMSTDIPWTFSVGRRPSTNGHLINLRDDDVEASPLAHAINVEFDGLSSKFDISKLTSVDGMYIKFCMGRGLSNAVEKFSTTGTPYATTDTDIQNVNLGGLIFSIYDNQQYSLITQYYNASHLIDVNSTYDGMDTVGNMHSFTVNFIVDGIGNDWSEFLDETTFFMSYSMSETDPHSAQTMLGSADSERGESYWVGLQMPTASENGKFGLEMNRGTKYWRSITYAEDTMIGSKIATRGMAYEAYWTEPFLKDSMSWQLRLTLIDYEYSGSNGFFGSVTGTPMTMDEAVAAGYGSMIVDKAADFRFYLRYKY